MRLKIFYNSSSENMEENITEFYNRDDLEIVDVQYKFSASDSVTKFAAFITYRKLKYRLPRNKRKEND